MMLAFELDMDTEKAWHLLSASPKDDFSRRLFVRTMLAHLEGATWSLLRELELFTGDGSDSEIAAAARAESYRLGVDGTVKVFTSKHDLRTLMPFVFNATYRHIESAERMSRTKEQLALFDVATTLRNRLVHPKALGDLTVTEKEIETASAVRMWFNTELQNLRRAVRAFYESRVWEAGPVVSGFTALGGDDQQGADPHALT